MTQEENNAGTIPICTESVVLNKKTTLTKCVVINFHETLMLVACNPHHLCTVLICSHGAVIVLNNDPQTTTRGLTQDQNKFKELQAGIISKLIASTRLTTLNADSPAAPSYNAILTCA